jgi:hypothetical protein
MPASETQKQRGALLTVVFWVGIGLTPLAAALVMLTGGGTGLRLACVLGILATALIGLAVMLRPDGASVRTEVEEMVFEELDVLREDVREDISTAARATHKAFSEKLQQLYETVEMLREQVESARAQGFAPTAKAAPPPQGRPAPQPSVGTAMVGGGVVRHTETVQVTTRQTIVDPHADDRSGTVYGGNGTAYGPRTAEPAPAPAGRRSAEDRGGGRRSAEDRPSERRQDWAPREESWTDQRLRERLSGASGEPRDRHSRDGNVLDGNVRDGNVRDGNLRDGNLRDGNLRDGSMRDGNGRDGNGRDDFRVEGREEFRLDPGRRPRPFERDERDDDAGDDPRWTDVRAGDRWASVRTDDRGREVRMGERRAAVRNDGASTELRIEDRWAQVRREDARRRGERFEPEPDTGFGDLSDIHRLAGHAQVPVHDSWSEATGWGDRRGGQPALPAAPAEPASSWTEGWRDDRERDRDREREPVRRRRAEPEDRERDDRDRDDRWEREESDRPSRARRPEFELNDERWR